MSILSKEPIPSFFSTPHKAIVLCEDGIWRFFNGKLHRVSEMNCFSFIYENTLVCVNRKSFVLIHPDRDENNQCVYDLLCLYNISEIEKR